jgi:hypothetical protein
MKKITSIFSLATLLLIGVASCTLQDGIDNDLSFLNSAASANLNKVFAISNDNSGNVRITPSGEGVSSYKVSFGHGSGASASATVLPGGSVTHAYPEGSYTVTIVSADITGKETSTTYPLQVTYRAPENLAVTIDHTVHKLTVSAKADYAASYLVYFGDATNETGTPMAKDQTLTHDYAKSGNYNVTVVALSGGAAKTQKVTAVKITDPFGLPITFDSEFIDDFFGTFGGGQKFEKVANPYSGGINTSANVGKYTKGYEGWSGTYSPLNTPIDFSVGKVIKVLVYNPDPALIGKKMNMELESAEGGTPANGVAVLKMPFTKSGEWEELTFDFSGISGIPSGTKFDQLVLRFNDTFDGAGAFFYIDNFRLTN